MEQERLRVEQKFRDALLAKAEDWRRGQLVRDYVRAVVDHVRTYSATSQVDVLDAWVERAQRVADSLDPMLQVDPDWVPGGKQRAPLSERGRYTRSAPSA